MGKIFTKGNFKTKKCVFCFRILKGLTWSQLSHEQYLHCIKFHEPKLKLLLTTYIQEFEII